MVTLVLSASILVPAVAGAAPVHVPLTDVPTGWGIDEGCLSSSVTFSSGRMITDSDGGGAAIRLTNPNGEWFATQNDQKGWSIEVRVKVDPVSDSNTCRSADIWASHGGATADELMMFGWGKSYVCVVYPSNVVLASMNTTSAFHTYRFVFKSGTLKLYVDGALQGSTIVSGGGGSQLLMFGTTDTWGGRQRIIWDRISYDTAIGEPACSIVGSAVADTINGTSSADNICPGYGNDVVFAGSGADSVPGFYGNDRLNGQGGNDRLFGGVGADYLNGGAGTDYCAGGQDTSTDTANSCESRVGIP